MPKTLMSVRELDDAIAIADARLAKCDDRTVLMSVAILANTFRQRLTEGEAEALGRLWIVDNSDVPRDLWEDAIVRLTRQFKWMPKPADFRDAVSHIMRERTTQRDRLAMMRKAADTEAKQPSRPPVAETREERLVVMRDVFRKHERWFKSAPVECELAKLQQREPAYVGIEADYMANRVEAPLPKTKAPEPIYKRTLPVEMRALQMRSQASYFRRIGNKRFADYLAKLAQELFPVDEHGRPVPTLTSEGIA